MHSYDWLQVAKLALNCLWGKMGQRDNMKQVEYFDQQAPFFDLLSASGKQIKKIDCIGEKMVRAEYINDSEFIREQRNINVVMAVYTTSYGRLQLYDCLDLLQHRCLYHDTDSLFFTSPADLALEPLKTGDALGDLTDELPPGRTIISFCSGGAKNYVYKMDDQSTSVTVKGITLNNRTKTVITYNLLRSMVMKDGPDCVNVVEPARISRDTKVGALYQQPMAKAYRVVYTKRAVMADGISTMPYGYREFK